MARKRKKRYGGVDLTETKRVLGTSEGPLFAEGKRNEGLLGRLRGKRSPKLTPLGIDPSGCERTKKKTGGRKPRWLWPDALRVCTAELTTLSPDKTSERFFLRGCGPAGGGSLNRGTGEKRYDSSRQQRKRTPPGPYSGPCRAVTFGRRVVLPRKRKG